MGMADYVDPTIAAVAQHIARLKQYGQPIQAAQPPAAPQQAPQSPISGLLGAARPYLPQAPAVLTDPEAAGAPRDVRAGLRPGNWPLQFFYNQQF